MQELFYAKSPHYRKKVLQSNIEDGNWKRVLAHVDGKIKHDEATESKRSCHRMSVRPFIFIAVLGANLHRGDNKGNGKESGRARRSLIVLLQQCAVILVLQ